MLLKNNRQTLIVIGLVLIGFIAFTLHRNYLVAATVNGKTISRLAVIGELEKQSGKKALDALVTRTLIQQAAAKKNIEITQKDIDTETKKIESSVKAQGGTLDEALTQQGMTRNDLSEQLKLQLMLEKLAGTGTKISDKDVEKYIETNADLFPTGTEKPPKDQIKAQLQQENTKEAVQKYLEDLKKKGSISYSSLYN